MPNWERVWDLTQDLFNNVGHKIEHGITSMFGSANS